MGCGVREWVTRDTLKSFGHERINEIKLAKKIYISEPDGNRVRGGQLAFLREK